MTNIEHYYIFYIDKGYTIYERTCGTKEAADERINFLKEEYRYDDAFYFKNDIPKGFKYFY